MGEIRASKPYVGRFAPSPTGELHFGSLIAAVASYLQARRHDGLWLVRIEDIDPPREVEGSAKRILADLRRLGLVPDRPVLHQASRFPAYREARDRLLSDGLAFRCSCTRSNLPPGEPYPGTCRHGPTRSTRRHSIRLKADDQPVHFIDGLQGPQEEYLASSSGDFVIWRSDDLPAYQLAVVIDDAFQGITEVVRGADLLDSTPRQIFLQRTLGLSSPAYIHLPVATIGGKKLSKRYGSDPVSTASPVESLRAVLDFLGQRPPALPDLGDLWAWAIENWSLSKVPEVAEIALDIPARNV